MIVTFLMTVLLQSTLERPALVRPLTTELDVEQSFHGIHLYAKGSIVTNMIRDLVSDFEFRSGIRRFVLAALSPIIQKNIGPWGCVVQRPFILHDTVCQPWSVSHTATCDSLLNDESIMADLKLPPL